MKIAHFKFFERSEVEKMTQNRRFETKIGERIIIKDSEQDLATFLDKSPCKFVIFGVPEMIGAEANREVGSSDTVWHSAIRTLLNFQSNTFLDGSEILLLGYFDFSDLQSLIDANASHAEERLEAQRHAVSVIDAEVEQLMNLITRYRKLPLVMGGGHNNSYPCIKGAAKGWNKAEIIELSQLNVINFDKATEYGPTEGRHGANAMRYAEEDGYLKKYFVLGVQEGHISQNIWIDIVNNPFMDCITFEDIFIHKKQRLKSALSQAAVFTEDSLTGIEFDMNLLETDCALRPLDARRYMVWVAQIVRPAYLYICGGYNSHPDRNGQLAGQLIADFVKSIIMVLSE